MLDNALRGHEPQRLGCFRAQAQQEFFERIPRMKRLITNLVAALVCTSCCAFLHSTGTATTLQDLINQACDPTSSQGLPPCEGKLSLEELKSRLQYSVEMLKRKEEMLERKEELTRSAMASWNKNIGLLYITLHKKSGS
jgi:hypothetical protein